jgi:cytochrome P450
MLRSTSMILPAPSKLTDVDPATSDATHVRLPVDAGSELDLSFESDPLAKLVALFAVHGDAFSVYSPSVRRQVCVFSHPEHVRHVLVDHHARYVKGIGIERVRILLGNGLMASEGDLWRSQRKMIQPGFHRSVLAGMVGHIKLANENLAGRWREAAHTGTAINLTQDMSEVTLEVVLRALFGERYEALVTPTENPFAILTEETERNLTFAYHFRALTSLLKAEIEWRRSTGYGGMDLVRLLMEARDRKSDRPMSDRQMLDEIMTLIVAGHETTASALNWLWYLVSQHPAVEHRLHAEADRLPDRDGNGLSVSQISFTAALIQETLRLYPPGWLLTRRSITADAIGDYALPPDTDVLISPYLVHRHPLFWRDPERFDPDRFLVSETAVERFAYLPFGLGPRACIGEQLATMEMQQHVLRIAREFRLEFDDRGAVEMESQVNLRTREPVFMRPRLRAAA